MGIAWKYKNPEEAHVGRMERQRIRRANGSRFIEQERARQKYKTDEQFRNRNKASAAEHFRKMSREKKAEKKKLEWVRLKADPERYEKYKIKSRYHQKTYRIRRAYGISIAEYNSMLLAQGGKCSICDRKMQLVVDHCHKSNKVRSLLCSPCNVGIGMFSEDISRIVKIISYLERHRGS